MRLTRGGNSVALLLDDRDGSVLATTNGSLYFAAANDQSKLLFASEEYILRQALLAQTSGVFQNAPVQQILNHAPATSCASTILYRSLSH